MSSNKRRVGYVKGGHAMSVHSSLDSVQESEHSHEINKPLRSPAVTVATPRPKGLKNVGNTCYANAVLQCLLSTALTHALLDPRARKIFRAYSFNLQILRKGSGSVDEEDDDTEKIELRRQFKEAKWLKEQNDSKLRDRCFWLARELKAITLEYQSGNGTTGSQSISEYLLGQTPRTPVVDPGCITRRPNLLCPSLRPYQQEDAHEFLRALLSTLAMNGRNRELSSLFDGLLESSITCLTCGRPSLTRDRYMDLSLDIASDDVDTLYDALDGFTCTETLSGDNKVHCHKCQAKRTTTKELRLATAPSVLVCHLKRFAFDKNGGLVRLGKKVKFPEKLRIKDYMSNLNRARPPPYELVAVLVHQGRSCEWGHYVAYVKNHGQWYCCNDSNVTPVSLDTVLQQQAYILMYEVAKMREKHGFPSPNGVPGTIPESRAGSIAETLMSTMLCGLDDSMLRDVCFQTKARNVAKKKKASSTKRAKKTRAKQGHEMPIPASRSDDVSTLMSESIVTAISRDTKEAPLAKSSMRRATSSTDLKREESSSTSVSLLHHHHRQRSYDKKRDFYA